MRKLGGRYALESVLARGGMSTLYVGHDEEQGDRVAVKVLKASLLDDPTQLARFRREALAISSLSHPGIVRARDLGREDDGTVFMVLDLVQGETLQQVIARDAPMPPARVLRIVDRILDALETCHERDVVHRDVKPANVMIDDDDAVKLIDFGLARVRGETAQKLTETGTVHGTPHYMAPEQCRGEDVGPAADIYAVGVLSYEMLAGKTPFAGNDAATFMAQHLFVDPPPLPNVVPGIAAAVMSALAKRPDDRPTARALREALAAGSIGADPVTRAAQAASFRVEHLAQSREDRALAPGQSRAQDVVGSAAAAVAAAVVWMPAGEETAAVLGCLGTAGITCRHVPDDGLPDPDAHAVIVTSRVDRVRRLRENSRKVPIVLIGVAGPEQTAEAIRLGADDMLLREAPTADLVTKVRRLAKRVKRMRA